jgi:hypothetical protein
VVAARLTPSTLISLIRIPYDSVIQLAFAHTQLWHPRLESQKALPEGARSPQPEGQQRADPFDDLDF